MPEAIQYLIIYVQLEQRFELNLAPRRLINANFLIHRNHQPQSSENSEFPTESVPQKQTKVSPTSTNTHRVCTGEKEFSISEHGWYKK